MTRHGGHSRGPGKDNDTGVPPHPGTARHPAVPGWARDAAVPAQTRDSGAPRLALDWVDPPEDLKDRIMAVVRAEPVPSPSFHVGFAARSGHDAAEPVPAIPLQRALAAVVGAESVALALLVALAAGGGLGDLVLALGRTVRRLVEVGGFVLVGLEAAHVALTQAWWLGPLLGAPLAAVAAVLGRWWLNAADWEEGVPC